MLGRLRAGHAPSRSVVAACMAAGLAGGVAIADPPGGDDTINACAKKANGQLRVVGSPGDCEPSESALSFNRQGPVGPQGPPGPKGDPGPQGPPGDSQVLLRNLGGLGEFVPPNSTRTVIIDCPNTATATGGGFDGVEPTSRVLASSPTQAGNGWRLVVRAGDTADIVFAEVVCAFIG